MAQNSTQQFLPVEEIREGVMVMKDRSVRSILMISSQNFALKSAEEQEATMFQFQEFLNSLDFSLQIVVQSRRVNITGYFDYLKDLEQKQQNQLLRKQTADYRQFIERLISGGSIMTKNFYVVVPFTLMETNSSGGAQKNGGFFSKIKPFGKISEKDFERLQAQLLQRMEYVALGLRRVGLQAIPLSSQEIIELLWSWHHPQESEVGYYPDIPPDLIK